MAWHMHIGRSSAFIASSLLILPHNSNLRFDDAARSHHLSSTMKADQDITQGDNSRVAAQKGSRPISTRYTLIILIFDLD